MQHGQDVYVDIGDQAIFYARVYESNLEPTTPANLDGIYIEWIIKTSKGRITKSTDDGGVKNYGYVPYYDTTIISFELSDSETAGIRPGTYYYTLRANIDGQKHGVLDGTCFVSGIVKELRRSLRTRLRTLGGQALSDITTSSTTPLMAHLPSARSQSS